MVPVSEGKKDNATVQAFVHCVLPPHLCTAEYVHLHYHEDEARCCALEERESDKAIER